MEITGGQSTAVACLGPPEVDFSETQRIAYLAQKIPIVAARKKYDPIVGRSTTLTFLWPLRMDFSEWSQIAYLDSKILILNRKKNFGHLSLSVGDSYVPQASDERFFRISPNYMFGPRKSYLQF